MTHPVDRLPEYVAGTVPPPVAVQIAAHLVGCARCRADAASWESLHTGVRESAATIAPPDGTLFVAVRARLDLLPAAPATAASPAAAAAPSAARPGGPSGSAGVQARGVPPTPVYSPGRPGRVAAALAPARIAGGLLARQGRVIGWVVWAVAVGAIGAGTCYAATVPGGRAGGLLALVVPLVAALAIAVACGAGGAVDELVRATPTSTRVVLLARLTLVLAGTVAAGVVGSAALALPRGDLALTELVLTWFGPLVPLSAVSFAVAVLWRSGAAAGAALAFWVLRLMSPSPVLDHAVAAVVDALWRPGPALILAAVGVGVVTVALAPVVARHRLRAAVP